MSNYAWVITKDYLAETPEEDDSGITGPSDASDEMLEEVKSGKGHIFRLYDDDGILYYKGRLLTYGDMTDGICFAPLDDFGAGWAGCTEVRWQGHPEWNC